MTTQNVANDPTPTPGPSNSNAPGDNISRFYVTDGEVTVGPVDGDQLARGISAGKVPLEAHVWCNGWDQWRDVAEYAREAGIMPATEKALATAKLARVTDLTALQLPSTDVERQTLSEAKDLRSASAIAFSLCATATGAECGWVHVHSREAGGAMVTLEGIGPRATFGVGRTVDPNDQALRAAKEGRTVLSEPVPGLVGSTVASRVLGTGISAVSVMMIPVLASGQLLAMIELGIASRSFTARDAAVAEQIARDVGALSRKRGWHREG